MTFRARPLTPTLSQRERENEATPRVIDILGAQGLIEPDGTGDAEPHDLTRQPLAFPAPRDVRLQALARGDEGFLMAMGYSTQRGYGGTHPFVGELRVGEAAVWIEPPELGFAIDIGDVTLTECQMVNQFAGSKTVPPQFTAAMGCASAMASARRWAWRWWTGPCGPRNWVRTPSHRPQNVEFVLSHCDNIQATGFVEHLKLPHYVDFQSELETIRSMRAQAAKPEREAAE